MKDFDKLSQLVNMLRLNSKNKEFSRDEILSELRKLGINQSAGALLIGTPTFSFRTEKFGKKKYKFTDTPIHKDLIKACYKKVNNSKSVVKEVSEEQAVSLLLQKGYIVKKPIGLDIDRLKKDGLYSKYMLYKLVDLP